VNDVNDGQVNELEEKFTSDSVGEDIIVDDGDIGEEVQLQGNDPFQIKQKHLELIRI
jgi:predicted fused transcriptional regulator/phosphomethylpyrimidine kinase